MRYVFEKFALGAEASGVRWSVVLSLTIVLLSSCRLDDNRLRGSRPHTDEPRGILSNVPSSPSGTETLNIDVGPDELMHYAYKIGEAATLDCALEAGYVTHPIDENITANISSLSDGLVRLCVVGRNAAGIWQAREDATVAEWMKDTTLPAIDDFTITNNNPTNTTLFDLSFASSDALTYCLLENNTNVGDCSWTSVPLPKSFTVSGTDEEKTLSAWVRDAEGKISSRSDAGPVTLDTTPPADVTGFTASSQVWTGYRVLRGLF